MEPAHTGVAGARTAAHGAAADTAVVCSSDAHVMLLGTVTAPLLAKRATSPVSGVHSRAVRPSDRSSHRSPELPESHASPLARSVNETPAVAPLECMQAESEGSSECTCARVSGSRVLSPHLPEGSTVTSA